MDPVPVARPSWRKPAGVGIILLLILVWAAIVAVGFDFVRSLPWPLHALYFLVAGIVWVLPLRPLLRWMETGRWRA
jgi:hypothetical protein